MTLSRVCGLFGVLVVVALAVVYLRVEQTRCAAKTLALESQWIALRRELWQVQTGAARLRAPGRLHDRMEWFDTDLIPPLPDQSEGAGTRLVLHQR